MTQHLARGGRRPLSSEDAAALERLRSGLAGELIAKRSALVARLEELESSRHAAPDGRGFDGHDGQDVDLGVELRMSDALDDQFRTALAAVDAAIDRLHHDRFGFCVGCSALIPLERLQAVPHTEHCVDCAAASSRG
jgi:DnaK suppressor protein